MFNVFWNLNYEHLNYPRKLGFENTKMSSEEEEFNSSDRAAPTRKNRYQEDPDNPADEILQELTGKKISRSKLFQGKTKKYSTENAEHRNKSMKEVSAADTHTPMINQKRVKNEKSKEVSKANSNGENEKPGNI